MLMNPKPVRKLVKPLKRRVLTMPTPQPTLVTVESKDTPVVVPLVVPPKPREFDAVEQSILNKQLQYVFRMSASSQWLTGSCGIHYESASGLLNMFGIIAREFEAKGKPLFTPKDFLQAIINQINIKTGKPAGFVFTTTSEQALVNKLFEEMGLVKYCVGITTYHWPTQKYMYMWYLTRDMYDPIAEPKIDTTTY